ncbi:MULTISPECIES: hypothetical protein [unclassified Mesorhizobium]|uniref:hypothetical protein n=1 Tax=unclassified Mesorhizobium TaxID=325217 RepID=UPI000F75C7BB|nr:MULTISPECIES: hypothetical protein [unclassified Mesorhizobium]AZO68471.1 hypothetical protein EJ075_28530 [Mesorhizobium sp. M6A.T.Cr.TU.016.01.1.1]RUU97346.1 hypothetical protein EOB36_27175 [Mesorhizobium sp. M6A.T.Cr.TU.017.01.1.1]RWP43055.1 MAG: hypothetical protein EOR05_28225 [Mesorhizobium sp.]RWP70779.1 MAG: hypothetical protein EOR09_25795 [Mesorhizobium sp.]RWQ63131.1 MAG: hypothetical protein EOS86_26450 [Mesorhizobium sp.]
MLVDEKKATAAKPRFQRSANLQPRKPHGQPRWAGIVRVGRMAEWPTWTPPAGGALAEGEDLKSNLLHGSAITFVVGVFG